MVSFQELVLGEDSPIYLQLVQYIKRGIVSGTIEDQDPVPSRRMVSALLGVNPNTIQKAYRMLEEEGLLRSQTGAKSVITISEDTIYNLRKELVESDVKSVLAAMKGMGIGKEEALALFQELWEVE